MESPGSDKLPADASERRADTATVRVGDGVDLGRGEIRALVAEVNEVIDRRSVETLFQPVVHLATAEVVGYEALARGPAGSRVESPLRLLEAGRLAGRLAELDWACAAAACRAAVAADLHPSMTIFLNFEPETLLTPCPPDLLGPARRALDYLRVMVEMKEELLTGAPDRIFDALAQVHEAGWGVAIDGAAVSAATLALLPLVHPDVLKLDLRGLRQHLATAAAMTDGARTYAEQTGATILAQGVEQVDDLLVAGFAGATYGQGWHFGHPGPLPAAKVMPRAVFPLLPKPAPIAPETPFQIVSQVRPTSITEKRFLVTLSRYLEEQSDAHGPHALLLVSFQSRARSSPASRERLQRLTERAAFTVVLGMTLDDVAHLGNRARMSEIAPGDPIGDEWTVAVLGPHYAGALVARDLGDSTADRNRRFDYVITHDRDLVLSVARVLLRRASKPAASGADL